MNCEYCQSPVHIWFQCPKKPDGWKPARLAKVRISTEASDSALTTPKSDVSASPPSHEKVHTQSGGNRAAEPTVNPDKTGRNSGGRGDRPSCDLASPILPVDTNSEPVVTIAANPPRLGPVTRKDADPPAPKPTKFDKKTWQRNYMRTYIRQYREDVKSGKRVPKKRG